MKTYGFQRSAFFVLMLCALFCAGCAPAQTIVSMNRMRLTQNPQATRKSIMKFVSPGMRIEKAKAVMEENHFTCSLKNEGAFTAGKKLYTNINYIYCDRQTKELVSRRWQVAVVHEKGRVKDVLVSTGLIGP